MKLAIFGATGHVGQEVIEQAIAEGHQVVAFARDGARVATAAGVTVVEGQLDDEDAVGRAIAGVDAVVSALGPRKNTPDQVEVFGRALENITSAMARHGVKRLVAISGAGVLMPSDTLTLDRRLIRFLLMRVARHVAEAKEREWAVISATDLEWVLVRPPRIVPGPKTGRYRVLTDRVPSPKVNRGDVADLMLKAATTDAWVRQGPIPGG